MLVEILVQLPPQHGDRFRLFQIIGKEQTRLGLPAEMPQQSLPGDALGDPAHAARAHAAEPPALGSLWRAMPPLALRLVDHVAEALHDPFAISRRRLDLLIARVLRNVAIQPVSLGADRD